MRTGRGIASRTMLTVGRGTSLVGIACRVCHRPLGVGDAVLVSFHGGEPSVMHAHACRHGAPAAAVLADHAVKPSARR